MKEIIRHFGPALLAAAAASGIIAMTVSMASSGGFLSRLVSAAVGASF